MQSKNQSSSSQLEIFNFLESISKSQESTVVILDKILDKVNNFNTGAVSSGVDISIGGGSSKKFQEALLTNMQSIIKLLQVIAINISKNKQFNARQIIKFFDKVTPEKVNALNSAFEGFGTTMNDLVDTFKSANDVLKEFLFRAFMLVLLLSSTIFQKAMKNSDKLIGMVNNIFDAKKEKAKAEISKNVRKAVGITMMVLLIALLPKIVSALQELEYVDWTSVSIFTAWFVSFVIVLNMIMKTSLKGMSSLGMTIDAKVIKEAGPFALFVALATAVNFMTMALVRTSDISWGSTLFLLGWLIMFSVVMKMYLKIYEKSTSLSISEEEAKKKKVTPFSNIGSVILKISLALIFANLIGWSGPMALLAFLTGLASIFLMFNRFGKKNGPFVVMQDFARGIGLVTLSLIALGFVNWAVIGEFSLIIITMGIAFRIALGGKPSSIIKGDKMTQNPIGIFAISVGVLVLAFVAMSEIITDTKVLIGIVALIAIVALLTAVVSGSIMKGTKMDSKPQTLINNSGKMTINNTKNRDENMKSFAIGIAIIVLTIYATAFLDWGKAFLFLIFVAALAAIVKWMNGDFDKSPIPVNGKTVKGGGKISAKDSRATAKTISAVVLIYVACLVVLDKLIDDAWSLAGKVIILMGMMILSIKAMKKMQEDSKTLTKANLKNLLKLVGITVGIVLAFTGILILVDKFITGDGFQLILKVTAILFAMLVSIYFMSKIVEHIDAKKITNAKLVKVLEISAISAGIFAIFSTIFLIIDSYKSNPTDMLIRAVAVGMAMIATIFSIFAIAYFVANTEISFGDLLKVLVIGAIAVAIYTLFSLIFIIIDGFQSDPMDMFYRSQIIALVILEIVVMMTILGVIMKAASALFPFIIIAGVVMLLASAVLYVAAEAFVLIDSIKSEPKDLLIRTQLICLSILEILALAIGIGVGIAASMGIVGIIMGIGLAFMGVAVGILLVASEAFYTIGESDIDKKKTQEFMDSLKIVVDGILNLAKEHGGGSSGGIFSAIGGLINRMAGNDPLSKIKRVIEIAKDYALVLKELSEVDLDNNSLEKFPSLLKDFIDTFKVSVDDSAKKIDDIFEAEETEKIFNIISIADALVNTLQTLANGKLDVWGKDKNGQLVVVDKKDIPWDELADPEKGPMRTIKRLIDMLITSFANGIELDRSQRKKIERVGEAMESLKPIFDAIKIIMDSAEILSDSDKMNNIVNNMPLMIDAIKKTFFMIATMNVSEGYFKIQSFNDFVTALSKIKWKDIQEGLDSFVPTLSTFVKSVSNADATKIPVITDMFTMICNRDLTKELKNTGKDFEYFIEVFNDGIEQNSGIVAFTDFLKTIDQFDGNRATQKLDKFEKSFSRVVKDINSISLEKALAVKQTMELFTKIDMKEEQRAMIQEIITMLDKIKEYQDIIAEKNGDIGETSKEIAKQTKETKEKIEKLADEGDVSGQLKFIMEKVNDLVLKVNALSTNTFKVDVNNSPLFVRTETNIMNNGSSSS